MAGLDDSVAISGDWVPPSPSSRAYFASALGDDIGSKFIPETTGDNNSGELFLGTAEQMTTPPVEKSVGKSCNELGELSSIPEQRQCSRGGLVERMAARAGFNAPLLNTESFRSTDLSVNTNIRSPYLTIPPGLSPTTLLESPVFLSNSLAQPSPTTGKLPLVTNGSGRNSIHEATNKSTDNIFEDMNTSFAFKPVPESSSSLYFGATSRVTPAALAQQPFPNKVSVQSENSLRLQQLEPANVHSQNQNQSSLTFQTNFSRSSTEKHNGANIVSADHRVYDQAGGIAEQSPPLDDPQDEEGDQRASGDSMSGVGGATSEDGYNWRKYGQKQVKGSEYPRSYYKCTHPECPVKKKVERSHEGHITEIIYKGAHNHPKPPPNRRSALGACNQLNEMQRDIPDSRPRNGANGDPIWSSAQKGTAGGTPDWRRDSIEVTSSASMTPEYGNGSASLQVPYGTPLESGDAVDASSAFSNEEDEDDRGAHGSVSQGYDGEGDESESKRRKIEAYASEMSGATRAIREPRVVVQTTSEVDILDDGYRWRKYGQKVVKGNPNPRSYYKCTSAGCTVRKHVERASHDLKSVITTYEGKHNHDVPAARSNSHVNSGASAGMTGQSATAMQTQMYRQEPSQVYNSMVRPTFGSYTLPTRQQLGLSPGFSFGMNQPSLSNLAMAGLGPGQTKLPGMPIHQYITQPRQVNDMGFMLPKGEMKMESVCEPGLHIPNNSSIYQQLMSRLPLGPHM